MHRHAGAKNIIGPQLKAARLSRRIPLTQQDLAARMTVLGVEIDRVSISKIETGKRFVRDFELLAIAEALNLPVDCLLKWNGPED